MAASTLTCPFCGLQDADEYFLTLHIEEIHTEGSPFVAKGDLASATAPEGKSQLAGPSPGQHPDDRDDPGDEYVACPQSDCGEEILLSELDEHLDYHFAERITLEEQQDSSLQSSSSTSRMHPSSPSSSKLPKPRSSASADDDETSVRSPLAQGVRPHTRSGDARHRSKRIRKTSREADSNRLGRKELGPHAWEAHMPDWLWKRLVAGPKVTKKTTIVKGGALSTQEVVENETPGLVPVLARLSTLDRDVAEAWFCHPAVVHIFALPKEGGFCGYRNIQMLIAYMQGSKAYGYEKFPGRVPTVPALQDAIEHAWDSGFNTIARAQTGGIKGTRKYIGTPEVLALFESLNIPCVPEPCNQKSGGPRAYEYLLDTVEAYFRSDAVEAAGEPLDGPDRVHRTAMAPVYLQQPGHSVTIIGLERRRDGNRNLVVLDPMYRTAPALIKLVGLPTITSPHTAAMQGCRRGIDRLRRHDSFELFKLTSNAPRIPSWSILSSFPKTPYVYVFFDLETDSYDVFPADAFDLLFPWFMYGALFIVHEGRFARVPNDASFDRLGVPALGCGCDWNEWRRKPDIAPLVLVAGKSRLNNHAVLYLTATGTEVTSNQTPSQNHQQFSSEGSTESDCLSNESAPLTANMCLDRTEGAFADTNTEVDPEHLITPAPPNYWSRETSSCSCWECRGNDAFTPAITSTGNPYSTPKRRSPRRRRRAHASVFPNARAWHSSGTSLSKASTAFVSSSSSNTSFSGCNGALHTHSTWFDSPRFDDANTLSGSLPSSPPTMTYSPWSLPSAYAPATPCNPMWSGESMMALYASSPLEAMYGLTSWDTSPDVWYGQPFQSFVDSSGMLWTWDAVAAALAGVRAAGGGV